MSAVAVEAATSQSAPAPLRRQFADAKHWSTLHAQYLARYPQPKWSTPCTPDAMASWLERLGVSQREWLVTGAYKSFADFITLNPAWPLRAWLGLALEMADEKAAGCAQRATLRAVGKHDPQ